MNAPAVVAEGLSKRYAIGPRPSLLTLRDRLATAWRAPRRHDARPFTWALDDVSFAIVPGEIVGVIGRNGAGKSTLLKILSRITEPTRGRARVRGRVGSLLEVGTGFHHELTGRENIFLNGAILGMSRREILAKFHEIVEFAEIGRFLDTAVKHYSSGMYGRLAFAVAAHLEPDILLVDEVLSIGDAAFQKKCLGKMTSVARGGRTVMFVSHNMAAVEVLCTRCLLIERGRVVDDGPTGRVIDGYARLVREGVVRGAIFPVANTAYGIALAAATPRITAGDGGWSLTVDVEIESRAKLTNIGVGLGLKAATGVTAAWIPPELSQLALASVEGRTSFRLRVPAIDRQLAGGEYLLTLWLRYANWEDVVRADDFAVVDVPAADPYGSGQAWELHRHGLVPLRVLLETGV